MSLLRSGLWFGAVGAAASLTHVVVFALALPWVWPEAANALGFGVAFVVSYLGHRHLTFQATAVGVGQSLPRFAATALAGFGCNELVFSALLRLAHWPSWLALLAGLLTAAGQTYLLSRFWAFRR